MRSSPIYTQRIEDRKVLKLIERIEKRTVIAKRIGVSRWYAGRIREGYRPHPRHWRELAELVTFTSAI